jgi:hypothetical protein
VGKTLWNDVGGRVAVDIDSFADHIYFVIDYQPGVIANFSGTLCVDEVYQGNLALLLGVDPPIAHQLSGNGPTFAEGYPRPAEIHDPASCRGVRCQARPLN